MKRSDAAVILDRHNKCRKGVNISGQPDPKQLSEAIDFAVKHLRKGTKSEKS